MSINGLMKPFRKAVAFVLAASMALSALVVTGGFHFNLVTAQAATSAADRTDFTSGLYRTDITSSPFTVTFTNNTASYAKVSCVGLSGAKEQVGEAQIAFTNHSASVDFPADTFPYGPTDIRVDAYDSANKLLDTAYLEVFNDIGVHTADGLANAPVNPDTSGMKVTFADDFSTMPNLTISGDNSGDKASNSAIAADASHNYATRKVDELRGGMFGWSFFEDYNPGSKYNPFAIVGNGGESYMKLTTSYWPEGNVPEASSYWQQKSTTGYLSSMGQDGSGFHTTGGHNQYFECRMFMGPNPALWPAFWLLTSNGGVSANGTYAPAIGGPSDELDVIEAYLGTPDSYSATSHTWADSNKYYPPGYSGWSGWTNLNQTIFKNVNVAEGWHTYGVLITEQTTTYYCDNVPVVTGQTLPISWQYGSYFIINGGTSDHFGIPQDGADTFGPSSQPLGFTRYGNACDTYVDWVRVYEDSDASDPASQTPRFELACQDNTLANPPGTLAQSVNNNTVQAYPGDFVTVKVNRNAAAQLLSGTYTLTMPGDGWQISTADGFVSCVTGTQVPFAAGSATDTLLFMAPDTIVGSTIGIAVDTALTGADGKPFYANMTVNLQTESDLGTEYQINSTTYPYRSKTGDTGGGWSDYDPAANDVVYFSTTGGWWSEGWG
ncbi:MAG: family 16 glycosylhydrolase, partial [Defluviitaleaceae bacterium]|nr:family 16 glycosylhydrolase [Defluviitaleaceae bacterium]